MSETRHGVDFDGEQVKGDPTTEGLADLMTDEYLVRRGIHPSDFGRYRDEVYRQSRENDLAVMREEWVGDDWPLPNPGESPRKVALVGKATSRLLAPWGEEGWEIWGVNEAPREGWTGSPPIRAHTRWFQLHPPHYLRVHHPPGIMDLALHWGEPTGVRLYMDRHYDEYPDSEEFSREKVSDELRPAFSWYKATSFDSMLMLAIAEGFEEIHCYGVDFRTFPIMDGESISARPCFEYWIGVANGRGIKVEVKHNGHLFKILHLACMSSSLEYGWDREPGHDLRLGVIDPTDKWRDLR